MTPTSTSRIIAGQIFTPDQMARARRGSLAWLAAGSQGAYVPAGMPSSFSYSRWRHGGWYVQQVRYPGGACGCVYRAKDTGRWHIACDERAVRETYASRDDAARAEWMIANAQTIALAA